MYKLIKNSNPSVVLYGTYEELEEIKKRLTELEMKVIELEERNV